MISSYLLFDTQKRLIIDYSSLHRCELSSSTSMLLPVWYAPRRLSVVTLTCHFRTCHGHVHVYSKKCNKNIFNKNFYEN